jgi:AraC-like DNA-binding protein
MTQDIPLVRTRYVHAFAAVLDRVGAPTGRMLDGVGLSGRVLEDGEAIIPAYQAWAFIGSAAEHEGIHDFGLQAGRASIDTYGEFSRRLFQAPNLYQAVQRFCQLARHEYSRADFYLSHRNQRAWFCRGPIDGSDVEKKHVELLVLTMMIATVRLVAGPDWRPSAIFLQTQDSRGVDGHESLRESNLQMGNRITAFEIPAYLLSRPMPSAGVRSVSREYERLDPNIITALRHIIAAMPNDRDWAIGPVAEAARMSPRTLQRRLNEANTTFSALVEDMRMSAAMSMLADNSMTLRDIALKLRYTDQANFTRAFRRWTGLSPQSYRRQQSTNGPERTM